ncbi:MAG TPA: YbjN domain-containing protein [Acidimicrobiia bacterium]
MKLSGVDQSAGSLDDAHELIGSHLEGPVAAESYVQHVEYDPELRRWYVRFTCDGRDATTIYFDLHQRTLRYEVYFLPMPDPPFDRSDVYDYVLRRNHTMYGARFSVGPDGDLYLVGRVALEHLSIDELDRIIGVLYELTERWFQPVVQLTYGRRPPTAPPLARDDK